MIDDYENGDDGSGPKGKAPDYTPSGTRRHDVLKISLNDKEPVIQALLDVGFSQVMISKALYVSTMTINEWTNNSAKLPKRRYYQLVGLLLWAGDNMSKALKTPGTGDVRKGLLRYKLGRLHDVYRNALDNPKYRISKEGVEAARDEHHEYLALLIE